MTWGHEGCAGGFHTRGFALHGHGDEGGLQEMFLCRGLASCDGLHEASSQGAFSQGFERGFAVHSHLEDAVTSLQPWHSLVLSYQRPELPSLCLPVNPQSDPVHPDALQCCQSFPVPSQCLPVLSKPLPVSSQCSKIHDVTPKPSPVLGAVTACPRTLQVPNTPDVFHHNPEPPPSPCTPP